MTFRLLSVAAATHASSYEAQLLSQAHSSSMAEAEAWESIKHKYVGGPYAGAGGMAVGSGSVGVEEFADDSEAIKAIRLFPSVMQSFGGLGPDATDAQIKEKFLPALKVMLPHGGYFHDTLCMPICGSNPRLARSSASLLLTRSPQQTTSACKTTARSHAQPATCS